MTMERRLISFTAPQLAWLDEEAARLGVSVPELIRRLVDKERGAYRRTRPVQQGLQMEYKKQEEKIA